MVDIQRVWVIVVIVLVVGGLGFLFYSVGGESSFVGKAIGDAVSLECNFNDNTVRCSDGSEFNARNVIRFVDGFVGSGVNLPQRESVSFSSERLNPLKGSIDFWFKPEGEDGGTLFITDPLHSDWMQLHVDGKNIVLRLHSTEQGRSSDSGEWDEHSWMDVLATADASLRQGEWNHIALSWKRSTDRTQPDEFHLFVDGRELILKTSFRTSVSRRADRERGSANNGFGLTASAGNLVTLPDSFGDQFILGGQGSGFALGNAGLFDEFKVHNFMKTSFCPYCQGYPEGPVLFTKPLFGGISSQHDITLSTKPLPLEIVDPLMDVLEVQGTAGEVEQLSFAIYANGVEIDDVEITISDLVSDSGEISSENVDVRVVKVWNQMGMGGLEPNMISMSGLFAGKSELLWSELGVHDNNGVMVPELLVYDDTQDLVDTVDPRTKAYSAPRITRDFHTSIGQDTTKQFWLEFKIPDDAEPGEYFGTIALNLDDEETSIRVGLRVLPFTLTDSSIDRWIFYRFTPLVGTVENQHEVISEELIRSHLEDIRQHGFNGVVLVSRFSSNAQRDRFFQLAREVGLEDVVQVCATETCSDISEEMAAAQRHGFEPLFYGFDEANHFDRDSFFPALKFIENVQNQGAQIVMSVTSTTAQEYGDRDSVMYDIHFISPGTIILQRELRNIEFVGQPEFLSMLEVKNLFPTLGDGEEQGTWVRASIRRADQYKIKHGQVNPFRGRLDARSSVYQVVGKVVEGNDGSVSLENILFEETPSIRVTHPELVGIAPDFLLYSDSFSYGSASPERAAFDDRLLHGGSPNLAGATYSYWQTGQNRPKHNRFRMGVAAWLSKLEGVSPYAYQHYSLPGVAYGLPYSEFNGAYIAEKGYLPAQMTTYPEASGSVPTIEWKALREGFDDYRYLVTLERALGALQQSDPKQYGVVLGELERELEKFREIAAWHTLSDRDFADLREFVINTLLEIDSGDSFFEGDQADLNGDGVVNSDDVVCLRESIIGVGECRSHGVARLDFTEDGFVNFDDVDLLQVRVDTGNFPGLYGDYDGDDELTRGDIACYQDEVRGQARCERALPLEFLDLDGNGAIDEDDLQLIAFRVRTGNYPLDIDLDQDGVLNQGDVDCELVKGGCELFDLDDSGDVCENDFVGLFSRDGVFEREVFQDGRRFNLLLINEYMGHLDSRYDREACAN